MEFETIICRREGPVLRITFDRPKVLNAFNQVLLQEVRQALDAGYKDRDVHVFLVDSHCEKAFSAGIDVAYVKDLDGWGTRGVGRELHQTFLALRTVEKPVVCAIDGLCLGAGLEFALSCDFMLASERARFGLPNIHRGIPAIVEAAILPLAVGIQATRELAYLGEFWDAEKALQRGLVQQVTSVETLAEEVDVLCAKLAAKPIQALGTQKEIIHKWMTTDLESAIDFSINTVVLNWLTKDQKEGMGAFLEKRNADFKGE